ncbi:MAG: DUF45 domain-containing protein [Erysipelotrichaceae bacterium]|nr:DUF45 domain-containing protein [Erysipelotrichaceae bacterium]
MVEIKGVVFNVEITRKKIKNMYLRLDGNTIKASVPVRMPEYEVYRFIESRKPWIYRAYDSQAYKLRTSMIYRGGDVFYVYGSPYRLVRSVGKKGFSIRDNVIYLSYKDDSEDGIKYLYKQFDRQLLQRAETLVDKYRESILIDYGYELRPELQAKIMKSRWGVCYMKKNRINISSYLIHYPLDCLEYIVVHEMTHFIIPNHSKRFYQIVGNNMPGYKDIVKKLRT